MAGSPGDGEVVISSQLSNEDRYYNDYDRDKHSPMRFHEPLNSDYDVVYRYDLEDDKDIILDEDFLMALGEDEDQAIDKGNFPCDGEHTREIKEDFYNRSPIIELSSISNYGIHSHERKPAESSAKYSSRDVLKRNDLNRSHHQLSHVIQRNALFKPVIPVITEDSGEERSSPFDELVVSKDKHHNVLNFDHRFNVGSTHRKVTMTTTTLPRRKSSISISEILSSDDEGSISSGEDAEMMKQYQNLASPSRVLPSPRSITARRHSIASSSVDHLEQILSLLRKKPLLEEEEESEFKVTEEAVNSSKKIDLPSTSKGNEKMLEWIESSEFKNSKDQDDKVKDETDLTANIMQPGRLESSAQRKPVRRFSIDVGNIHSMDHMVEDPLFAREILHQKIINLASSQDSIDEKDVREDDTSNGNVSQISLQRTRRLSIGNGMAPAFQPITKRKSVSKMDTAISSPRQSAFSDFQRSQERPKDDGLISGTASQPAPARLKQRRSSWACTGAHPAIQLASRVTLLRQSSYNDDAETTERLEVRDPYRLTLHFISDPKQSKKLKTLLRPLTHSVAPKLKLFNYVDRSERVVFDNKDPDVMAIPALAIMIFLQEEQGIERILKARQYLKEEPWQLHHKDLVGGNVVPYPTNNQDFYSHADGMPLWAVRQILGKDRLRFMIFVSHDNWDDTVMLYSKILSRDVEFQKEGFCYFLVFCCKKLNIEVQLALKRLPLGFVPTPLDAALLQFKVHDMGQLVPLLPRVCSPISAKRWQTTDLDGNKLLLLVQHELGNENGRAPHREDDGENPETSGKSSPNSDEDASSTSETNYNFSDISNYV